MDNVDGLVGVDPDDTVEIMLGGAVFTVGPIPSGIWESISARRSQALHAAHRKAVQTITLLGEIPGDLISKEGEHPITKAEAMAYADPDFIRTVTVVSQEAAMYGVRKHDKFLTKKHEPVPLDFVEIEIDGAKVKRLAESSMRYYRPNGQVTRSIFNSLYQLNELEGPAKKA